MQTTLLILLKLLFLVILNLPVAFFSICDMGVMPIWHDLLVKFRLGNDGEGHGYYIKGSRKKMVEYTNQMESELFWLLCKKQEKCPLWVPTL